MKRAFASLPAILLFLLCFCPGSLAQKDTDKGWLPAGTDHKHVTVFYRVGDDNTIQIKFKNNSDQSVSLTYQIHCEQKEGSGWKQTSSYRGADAVIDANGQTDTGYNTGFPVRNITVEIITTHYGK